MFEAGFMYVYPIQLLGNGRHVHNYNMGGVKGFPIP